MRRSTLVATVLMASLCARPVLAQETREAMIAAEQHKKAREAPSSQEGTGIVGKVTDWFDSHRVLDWMKSRPAGHDGFWIRPHIGGLTRGAGFAVGPDVIVPLAPHRLELHARGAISTRRYLLGLAEVVAPHLLDDRLELAAGATYRYSPQEDFWGIGPDSPGPRTNYLFESRDYRASARLKIVGPVRVGAIAGYFQPTIASGKDPRFPSTDLTTFADATPGLTPHPDLHYATAFVDVDTRDNPDLVRRGTHLYVAASRHIDRALDRFTFSTVDAEALQVVPLVGDTRLVLFGRMVSQQAAAGRDVPFYLMPWLGGDDSVRGYSTYRFRDRSLAHVNAEYQWPIFEYMDMAFFADAGNVAPAPGDFSADDLKTAYGIGFRFHTDRRFVLRIDAALAGSGVRSVVFRLRPAF